MQKQKSLHLKLPDWVKWSYDLLIESLDVQWQPFKNLELSKLAAGLFVHVMLYYLFFTSKHDVCE
jgi:hypothetical protein